ncbi:metallophosphoesterase [Candidatus Woesearchaeota archaeon]|nr:metallophosphoesterase [Candidatus Woesearchaeota archaeon]
MEIHAGIEIIDLALYLKKEKILILADFHIGYEEALTKQGFLVPRFQFKDMSERLENIFKKVKPKIIIINGDIKHEFGQISEQEWRETLKLIDYLSKKSEKLILIRGNHDTILGPIAKKRNIETAAEYKTGNTLIIHGHKIPKLDKKIKKIIIAHEHPCVSLKEGPKIEKYKCFLKGKFKNKILIVQPSFNLVTEGTDVLQEKLLSPFLQQKLSSFEFWLVSDKVYYFGKLKNIQT